MGDLEEALNGLLSNPREMEAVARMAQTLFSGAGDGDGAEETAGGDSQAAPPQPKPGAEYAGGKNDKGALVKALSPYLSPERRARLEKAVRMAGMLRLAGTAFHGLGGGAGV